MKHFVLKICLFTLIFISSSLSQSYRDIGTLSSVNAVAYNPAGTQIAVASQDPKLSIWDVNTGILIRTLAGHSNVINSVSFSPDGSKIVTGSWDNSIKIWDAVTGSLIRTLSGHTGGVYSVKFSPTGDTLISGSEDKTIMLWNVNTGSLIKTLSDPSGNVTSVCFSPDGSRIVSAGGTDRTVKVWNVASGSLLQILTGHTGYVWSVCYTPDGTKILSTGEDRTIRIWDANIYFIQRTLYGHTNTIKSIAMSPDGSKFVTGSYDMTIRIWELSSGNILTTINGHTDLVNSVCFNPDGTKITSGSSDLTIKTWDATSGIMLNIISGHVGLVTAICYTPDGTKLITGGADKTIRIWEVSSGNLLRIITGHTDTITSIKVSPDSTKIVSGSLDNSVRVWDLSTGNLVFILSGVSAGVNAVCYSPDSTKIAAALNNNTIRVWDAVYGGSLSTLFGHSGPVYSVNFSPDNSKIVSGGGDNTVRIWDANTGNPLLTLVGHSAAVTSVSFNNDGTQVLSGSADRGIRTWNITTGLVLKVFLGHTGGILSLSYSPDGTKIISGSSDNTVRIWDEATQTTLHNIPTGTSRPRVVLFSPDGKKSIYSNSDHMTIYYHTSLQISGKVTLDGNPLNGVALLLYQNGNPYGSAYSNTTGDYSFIVDPGYDYRVAPQTTSYIFTPADAVFPNLSTAATQNFTAALNMLTLSGIVISGTNPLNGVLVTLSGSANGTITTNANGQYTFSVVAGGNYTLTPSLTNYTFTPISQTFNSIQASQMFNFQGNLITFSISGTVRSNGTALSGVTIDLSGGSTATVTTDVNGYYMLPVGIGGTYTITPSKTYYTFSPVSQLFTNVMSNQVQDFTGTLNTIILSGYVTFNGSGLAGTTVTLGGTQTGTVTTDASGYYTFSVYSGGSYTITPTMTNYVFTPGSRTYDIVQSNQAQNFAAALNTFTISGVITLNTLGFNGVTVTLSGSASETKTTDANGNYSFTVGAGGTYTITPSKVDYAFSPAGQTYTNIQSNQVQNFTASLLTYTISGVVTINNTGLSGVIIDISGGITGTTITDGSGSYTFSVPGGGTYILTPMKLNYRFNPEAQTFTSIHGNQVLNFIATNASVPDIPTLTYPLNFAANISISPTFNWNVYGNTMASDLQIATSSTFGFSDIVYDLSTITQNSYTVQNLKFNTSYYWRVRAKNTYGTSKWSTAWGFTTIPIPLLAPVLVYPANNAMNVPVPTTFSWNAVSGAKDYVYHISEDYSFSTVKIAFSTGGALTAMEYGLENNKTYYWRVRAEDGTFQSAWSDIWTFTIVPNSPSIPVQFLPQNNTTLKVDYSNPSVTLAWNPANNSTSYKVQLATNPNFNPLTAEFNDLTATNCMATVENGKQYYWKVRGYNQTLAGEWSEIWSFNSLLVGVEALNKMPGKEYNLDQNYPNPFNPETRIEYSIPENAFVTIKVYNTYGKEMITLVNKEQNRGVYSIRWEPENLPSGVYYYRLQAGAFKDMKKMLYIR